MKNRPLSFYHNRTEIYINLKHARTHAHTRTSGSSLSLAHPVEPATPGGISHCSLTSATDLSSRITCCCCWSLPPPDLLTARPDWAVRPSPAPSPDCPGSDRCCCRSHKRAPAEVGSGCASEWTNARVFCLCLGRDCLAGCSNSHCRYWSSWSLCCWSWLL